MKPDTSFVEFYTKMGFLEYPFSHWSAEQETARQQALFIRPNYYGPIAEKFQSGSGMFLVGERGTGKTASLYDLVRSAPNRALVIDIHSFSEISTEHTPADIYRLISARVVDAIMHHIIKYPFKILKLSKSKRSLLSYVLSEFCTPISKGDLKRNIEIIQNSPLKRWTRNIYSVMRAPLNISANFGVNIVTDIIARASGVQVAGAAYAEVREFFPDIPFRADSDFNSVSASLRLIEYLSDISKALGFSKTIIVIDKLDEDSRLEGDAERIAEFVKGIVTETSLHLSRDIQIIVSIWSVPFSMLQKTENVRTQKMNVENLSWDRRDLERALDNRISVYSRRSVADHRVLFSPMLNEKDIEDIFVLANSNPRDLWHIFDQIIKEQYKIDRESKILTREAVSSGIREFVAKFNYFEYYPRRANARANSMDVYAYIRHLLRLSGPEFTRNQLTERSGVSGGSVNNYVQGMENMGLISSRGQTGGNVNYIIRDPKIRYALEHGIDISLG